MNRLYKNSRRVSITFPISIWEDILLHWLIFPPFLLSTVILQSRSYFSLQRAQNQNFFTIFHPFHYKFQKLHVCISDLLSCLKQSSTPDVFLHKINENKWKYWFPSLGNVLISSVSTFCCYIKDKTIIFSSIFEVKIKYTNDLFDTLSADRIGRNSRRGWP